MRRPRGFTPIRQLVWGFTPPLRAGFTLLELMLVVIIIGTLASMALPQYLKAVERARVAEALVVLSAIRGAELRYKADHDGASYTLDLETDLDVTLPDSSWWRFCVSNRDVGVGQVVAERQSGDFQGSTVALHIETGTLCASDSIYGLAACTVSCPPP